MCGLVGIIKNNNSAPEIISSLSLLQYRGYDSYGIAVVDNQNNLGVFKKLGSVADSDTGLVGSIGIGHTRWATHGSVTLDNTHPFSTDQIAVAQNGIITNFQTIKDKFPSFDFKSQTDTECVLPLLLSNSERSINDKLGELTNLLEGSYSMLILDAKARSIHFMVRGVNPLLIGIKDNTKLIGSDIKLFKGFEEVIDVQDGQYGSLSETGLSIHPNKPHVIKVHNEVIRPVKTGETWFETEFMQQPSILKDALNEEFRYVEIASKEISLVGCGSAHLVGCLGAYWFRQIGGIKAHSYIPSTLPDDDNTLVGISQSGETVDLLKALKHSTSSQKIAVLNNVYSSASKYVDHIIPIHAHEEFSVASTKATTCQMLSLLRYAAHVGGVDLTQKIMEVLDLMQHFIDTRLQEVQQVAEQCYRKQSLLIIARDILFPIACECALKIKELSYIHAEAIPSPELKHGPLALIDQDTVVICFATDAEPVVSEIMSRGGKVFVFTNCPNDFSNATNIKMPSIQKEFLPFLYILPSQWLAYSMAKLRGNPIDMPRNLAKSVTVE